MSELRTRMIRDMTVRGFSPRTHEAYIAAVVRLAKYYKRSPDQLTNDEVQTYLAHLFQERKLSWSTCSQAAHAFRFLYHVTLGHDRAQFHVPAPRQPQKLPEILSREEVWRLFRACTRVRDRLLLATTYAAGLRLSEVVHHKVSDCAGRMQLIATIEDPAVIQRILAHLGLPGARDGPSFPSAVSVAPAAEPVLPSVTV
jgi:integrase/recombinase XerD